jgi:hypothetical protein
MLYRSVLGVLLLSASAALAQTAAPPLQIKELADRQARRFPQPVRVGDLIGRDVLKPVEAQPVLGHVMAIVRRADGGLDVIIRFGGVLGFGSRPIAVPVEAVALLGEFVAVMDFTPEQLETFPTVGGSGPAPLGPDEVIRVGLVKPFH